MTARIPPGGRREIGTAAWLFARAAGLVARTDPPRVFLTLGRHRRLFRGWLHFAGRLMPGGRLPRRETELVIIATAHLTGSEYEWVQHTAMSKRYGVTDADIEAIAADRIAEGWSARERVMVAVASRMVRTGDVDDATWNELMAHLSPGEAIELLMLVGHYEMLGKVLGVLRVEPDRGWPRRACVDGRNVPR